MGHGLDDLHRRIESEAAARREGDSELGRQNWGLAPKEAGVIDVAFFEALAPYVTWLCLALVLAAVGKLVKRYVPRLRLWCGGCFA